MATLQECSGGLDVRGTAGECVAGRGRGSYDICGSCYNSFITGVDPAPPTPTAGGGGSASATARPAGGGLGATVAGGGGDGRASKGFERTMA